MAQASRLSTVHIPTDSETRPTRWIKAAVFTIRRRGACNIVKGYFFLLRHEYREESNYTRVYISVTFNFNFSIFPTGAGAPQLCRRARTPRKRAWATLGAF